MNDRSRFPEISWDSLTENDEHECAECRTLGDYCTKHFTFINGYREGAKAMRARIASDLYGEAIRRSASPRGNVWTVIAQDISERIRRNLPFEQEAQRFEHGD